MCLQCSATIGAFILFLLGNAEAPLGQEGSYEPETGDKHSEKMSGHDSAPETMNLYQLWIPVLDLHMMQTVNNSAWEWEEFESPVPRSS